MVFAEASLLIRGQKPPAATRLHLVRHRGAMTDLLAKSPDQVIQGERERERERARARARVRSTHTMRDGKAEERKVIRVEGITFPRPPLIQTHLHDLEYTIKIAPIL